jgi:hypothetical protein
MTKVAGPILSVANIGGCCALSGDEDSLAFQAAGIRVSIAPHNVEVDPSAYAINPREGPNLPDQPTIYIWSDKEPRLPEWSAEIASHTVELFEVVTHIENCAIAR